MNPLTNVKNITKLNEREIQLGVSQKSSWHNQYKDSAWLFIGGLPFDLTEGDVICVFSQYGEIVNINLVRDKKTGKSRGFCFLCYENQQSTVLAVDNFNGIKILGRTIRVDHVSNYKPPKEHEDDEEELKGLRNEGCAPKMPIPEEPKDQDEDVPQPKPKREKKKKKDKKKKKKKKRAKSSSSDSTDSEVSVEECVTEKRPSIFKPNAQENREDFTIKVKTEKYDQGYEKYINRQSSSRDRSQIRDRESGRIENHNSPVQNRLPLREDGSRRPHNPNSSSRDRLPDLEHDTRPNRNYVSSSRDRPSSHDSDSRLKQTASSHAECRNRSPSEEHLSRQKDKRSPAREHNSRQSRDKSHIPEREFREKRKRDSPSRDRSQDYLRDDANGRKNNRGFSSRHEPSRFEDRRKNI